MRVEYPFSAVVGQDDLKLALLLIAVDPGIGGVLIKGERGTAKSTIARGLAALLPAKSGGQPAPFVELPLGATEDRVVGSLDITQVLADGRAQLRSGLLARADGGVLYVDEVNLLPDHLVDLLLDAAASGWVTIERDSVSAGEAARFVLIGTMNPEEGDLRPQFLDRFGLSVQVRGLTTAELRIAAIGARLAFDENPQRVVQAAAPAEDALRESILSARARLPSLTTTNLHLAMVAAISTEHRLDGIRGDLAIIKAARALAAWQAATEITAEHIRRAAELALPHRTRRKAASGARRPADNPPAAQPQSLPQSGTAGGTGISNSSEGNASQPAPAVALDGSLGLLSEQIDRDSVGRRGGDSTAARQALRVAPFDQRGTLAVTQTLTAAASRGVRVGAGGVALLQGDLMQHQRKGNGHTSVLFLVDASGSMAIQRRLAVAKGAALGLLQSSYQRRDEVALMVFRGEGTHLVLPFTGHVARIEQALNDVPSGGRTPLARALSDAAVLLQARDPALLVIFTDGRANVSMGDADPWDEALAACLPLRNACAGALVVDCEQGPISLGRAKQLAQVLQAECVSLNMLEAADLAIKIDRRLDAL